MDQTQYYKDPPLLIFELMKRTFGDQFSYYLGAPNVAFPADGYPLIVVQSLESRSNITNAPTGTDSVQERIGIFFMLNMMDDLSASSTEQLTMRRLYNYIEGRDPATGFYKVGTAKNALRSNLDLSNPDTGNPTTINNDISVTYNPPGDNPDMPSIVSAALEVITVERVQVIR
jgi:hypothetical protein